jgi:uncharacterized protein (DUF433 family)
LESENVIGAFGEEHAARLSGLSIGQLRSWDRSRFFCPSYGFEDRRLPYSRVYSFRDIVSLRVLGMLRNEYGVPMQHLRKVSEKLAHLGDTKWISTTLEVLCKRVVFVDPQTEQKREVVSGQSVLNIPLRVVISSTRAAIAEMNKRDSAEAGKIIHAKFIMGNEDIFKGSRVTVMAVKRYLDGGFSPDAIIAEFPDLTLDDVEAARNYVVGNQAA